MKNLTLNLKKEYFLEIKNGIKKFEYRLKNEYWSKRLINKNYDKMIIKLGYPSNKEVDKIIEKKYKGYIIEKIKHPLFGDNEVEVFSLILD